jgi:hypothetical protein
VVSQFFSFLSQIEKNFKKLKRVAHITFDGLSESVPNDFLAHSAKKFITLHNPLTWGFWKLCLGMKMLSDDLELAARVGFTPPKWGGSQNI